jgi:hypothetical protein
LNNWYRDKGKLSAQLPVRKNVDYHLKFGNETYQAVENGDEYVFTLPNGTPVSNLMLSSESPEGAAISFNSGGENFTPDVPRKFTITAQDGTTRDIFIKVLVESHNPNGGGDTPGGETPGGGDTPGGGETPGGSETPGGGGGCDAGLGSLLLAASCLVLKKRG